MPAHNGDPVWWDEAAQEWRTNFRSPPNFDGRMIDEDSGERTLTAAEADLVERSCDAADLAEREEAESERDAFFAALAAEVDDQEGDDEEVGDEEEALWPPARHPGLDPGSAGIVTVDEDVTFDEDRRIPGQARDDDHPLPIHVKSSRGP